MTGAQRLREHFVPIGTALMLALPLAGIGTPARAESRPALPPGLEGERVAVPEGELAGHALSVSQVSSRLGPAQALAEVERHWRRDDEGPIVRAESEGWSVLSRRIGERFETLQLRASADGGSEGLLTHWSARARSPRSERVLERLLPADARVMRQLASRDAAPDGYRSADTLIAELPHGIDEAERRLEAHLRRAGFSAMPMPAVRSALTWRNDRARFYRRAGAEVMVTLHARERDTALVLYHVEVPR